MTNNKFNLFIDTSEYLIIGLLTPDLNWINYEFINEKRSATLIHKIILELCHKFDLNLKDLDTIFSVSGPGSYTGMRISEGILQTTELLGISTYSFYHFEIPKFLNIKNGRWISKAFKNEYFLYHWEGQEAKNELLSRKQLEQFFANNVNDDFVATSFINALDEFILLLNPRIIETHQMLFKNPQLIFKTIIELNQKNGPFYFRSNENEFRMVESKKIAQ